MKPLVVPVRPYCSLGRLGPWQWLTLAAMFTAWYCVTTPTMKAVAIIFAAAFSILEWNFYKHSTHYPDGTTQLSVAVVAPGFTSVEQFMMNVLYIPILVFGFRMIVPSAVVRIPLAPLNIWTLEIVQGSVLRAFYGYNPAWDYTPFADGRLCGMIKIGHWPFWVGLGVMMEVAALIVA